MTNTSDVPFARRATPLKRATLLPLIGITYCMVAGGPYGLEDLVHNAGYRNAVLLLLITPVLWSFPVTLMVSELSAALPEEGGYYVWVRRGLGPFWGFQEAWLSFAASIFDMAVYPTLFVTYLERVWPPAHGREVLIGVALIVLCVGINLAGIRPVGAGSLAMTLALLLPFAVMIVLALFSGGHPAPPAGAAAAGVGKLNLLGGVLVVMWNYMGWDNTSTIAGEVDRPQRTYPLAMGISVLLVAATYVLPVAAVSRSGVVPESWATGSWVDVGRAVAPGPHFGQVLAVAITAGGMVSAFSMFNALILSYSRLPIAMAADGFLPKFMGVRGRRTGAPWVAILICAVGWGMCLTLGFERLLFLDTLLYGLGLVLEFAALVALRLREPDLARPYKVPGGLVGCILISLGPLPLMAAAAVQAYNDEGARKGLEICAVATVLGVALYFVALAINPRLRQAGRRFPPGACANCGYDLTGNVSGVCPECGTAVTQA